MKHALKRAMRYWRCNEWIRFWTTAADREQPDVNAIREHVARIPIATNERRVCP